MSPVPEPLGSVFAVLFGLVLGSFLNVCIQRLPHEESVVRPGSRCPRCGAAIRPWDNVPLLSWVLLRGRCRSCKTPISWRYPLVEALGGALVLALWRTYGPSAGFLIASAFALSLVVLFFTDLDHQLLPDVITISGTIAGLLAAFWNPFLGPPGLGRIWLAAGGAVLGGVGLWAVGAGYSRLRGVDAMGLGDAKMMAMVGAFTGPIGVLFTLLAGSVVGAIVGLALVPLRGRTLQDTLPFGCFLAPAALAALLVGRQAFEGWLSLASSGI